jgi:hypothetical protein
MSAPSTPAPRQGQVGPGPRAGVGAPALGGGVRLGGQQPGVDVRGFPATARRPAQRGAVRGLALPEQQVITIGVDHLARLQAQRLRARAPPVAGRLPAALAGLEVVPGRVLGRAAVHLLPDVVEVIALAQGRHHRHRLIPRQAERSSPRSSCGAWVWSCDRSYTKGGKTADQDQKRETYKTGITDAGWPGTGQRSRSPG